MLAFKVKIKSKIQWWLAIETLLIRSTMWHVRTTTVSTLLY